MIDMHADPKRMIFGKHRAKLGRDSLWQENRDARADAEKLDMRDRAQAAQNFLELIFAENERIAAAQKHVAHFGVLFEVAERFLEIGVQFLFANTADDAAARAISTITRTAIGHEKEYPVGIAMHEPWHRHVRIFTTWIGHVVRRRPRFLDPRNDLTPDRIVRISFARNQIEKMGRDGERELIAGEQDAAAFFLAEIEMLLELSEGRNSVLKLPLPIVPELRYDSAIVGPVTGRVRHELFPIAIP